MAVRQYLERLPRYLSMRQMRMLAAVAEHGSVLKASRELRIAQPSVSRTLTELEAALGVRLFERSARGMTLTVFGEALLRRVKTIFGELRDADEDLRSLKEGWYGHVHIGCTRLLSSGVLAPLLSELLRERPGLNFSVLEADSDALLEALRDRSVDIALGRLPASGHRAEDLDYELLFHEELLLLAGPEHRLSGERTVSLRDLAEESWGLPMPSSMLYRVIQQTFAGLDRPLPAARVQADSVDIMLQLVEAGDVVTLIPASLALEKAARYRLKLMRPVEPMEYGPVGTLMLKARQPTPAMNLFKSFLKDQFGALTGSAPVKAARAPSPGRRKSTASAPERTRT